MSDLLRLLIISRFNVIEQHFRIGCWIVAALLLAVLMAGSVSSQEITSVGSFEGALDGWTVATPVTGTLTTTYSNIQGSKVLTAQEGASFGLAKSFDIRARLENLGAFITRKPLTVEAGDILSGWSYFGSGWIGFIVSHGSRARIFVADGLGELVASLVYYEASESARWERFEYKFSRSGRFTLELQINSSMFSMGGDYVGLDGLVITSPDRTPPVVTAPGSISISLNPGEAELAPADDRLSVFLSGATASDGTDGDITATAVNLPQSFALGETEIRFEATDKSGNTGFGISKVTVVKRNIPPIAIDDSAKGKSGQAASIAVTDNDSDADGDSLTVTIAQPPKHGTVIVTANGITAYTAEVDFIGSDVFTYNINDSRGGTASATVTITVKSALGPVVTVPPELVIEVDAGVGQVAASDKRIAEFLSGATALDEIDGDVSAVAVDVPRTFQLGETTVRFQAVDLDGNIGFAYSKVTVKSIPGICKSAPDLVDFEPDSADTHVGPFYSVRPIPSEAIFSKQDAQALHPDLVAFRIVDGIRQGYKFLPAENTWIVDYDLVDHTPADPELLGKTYYGFAPEETYSVYESVVGGIVSLRYIGYDCFALNRGPWGGSYFTPFDYEYAGGGSIFDRRDLAKNWQRISFKMNWGLTRDAADSGESYWLNKKHWGSDKFRQLVFAAHVDVAIFSDEDLAKRIMSIGHNLGYPCPNSIYEPGDERIESLYQPGEIFGAVFDEENVRLETGTGKKHFESPFLFFGRRCRSVIRVFLGVGGRIGGRIHSAEKFGGFDSHASSLEINQLGKAIVNKVLENLECITAGFELRNSQNLVELSEAFKALPIPVDSYDRDKNIYVYTLPEKNPVKPIPKAVSGKPSPGVSPPADPQPLPEKPRTPTDIMSAIEKNFHKLSHEEQEELINKLKHLPLDEREQLSPLFMDLLKKGK